MSCIWPVNATDAPINPFHPHSIRTEAGFSWKRCLASVSLLICFEFSITQFTLQHHATMLRQAATPVYCTCPKTSSAAQVVHMQIPFVSSAQRISCC